VERGVLPVRREHPVLLVERERAADLGALLAGQRRVRPHPPLSLEAHGAGVEVPGEFHLAVHRQQRLVVHVGDVADDAPVLAEDAHPIPRVAL
jgi:hypothetical protein